MGPDAQAPPDSHEPPSLLSPVSSREGGSWFALLRGEIAHAAGQRHQQLLRHAATEQ